MEIGKGSALDDCCGDCLLLVRFQLFPFDFHKEKIWSLVEWLFILLERRWCAINERQRRFADEYIISGNAYQSAIKAGYSQKYAKADSSKLLENTGIKSYIAERMAELEKQKIAKQDEVLQVFTSILRQELTEEVVQLDTESGQFVRTLKKPSIAEVIKAGSELMKRYPLDLELKKLQLEIEKLKQQVAGDEEQEDKLLQFSKALNERFGDD